MATLIGNGGHGSDIAATLDMELWTWYAHHDFWDGEGRYILGVNDPQIRAQLAEKYDRLDDAWVHDTAHIGVNVTIGAGTHINYATSMTRTTIGAHCTVSPGVTICGDVTIGDRCLIGAGAVICDRVQIGDDATIGAGTIILPESNIPDGTTWVGNPARQIK